MRAVAFRFSPSRGTIAPGALPIGAPVLIGSLVIYGTPMDGEVLTLIPGQWAPVTVEVPSVLTDSTVLTDPTTLGG